MKRSLAVVIILALAVSVPLAWSQGGTSEQHIKTLFDQVHRSKVKSRHQLLRRNFSRRLHVNPR